MQKGACVGVDPTLFFPDRSNAEVQTAKAVCHRCPVEKICLDYALTVGERFGVWGGRSERERRKLRRQRINTKAS